MSHSVRPHRWKPTRLPRPWDSPGKNTGVGCHFLLQCMKVKSEVASVVSDSSRPHGLQPSRLLLPWDFPGKSTRVGCQSLLRIMSLRVKKKNLPPNLFKMNSTFRHLQTALLSIITKRCNLHVKSILDIMNFILFFIEF